MCNSSVECPDLSWDSMTAKREIKESAWKAFWRYAEGTRRKCREKKRMTSVACNYPRDWRIYPPRGRSFPLYSLAYANKSQESKCRGEDTSLDCKRPQTKVLAIRRRLPLNVVSRVTRKKRWHWRSSLHRDGFVVSTYPFHRKVQGEKPNGNVSWVKIMCPSHTLAANQRQEVRAESDMKKDSLVSKFSRFACHRGHLDAWKKMN